MAETGLNSQRIDFRPTYTTFRPLSEQILGLSHRHKIGVRIDQSYGTQIWRSVQQN